MVVGGWVGVGVDMDAVCGCGCLGAWEGVCVKVCVKGCMGVIILLCVLQKYVQLQWVFVTA